ncbi:bacillithiol biosynthesis cysteine-adding enzyme BshC [Jiulongibacter sediminis]|uniref:bacillithiol biosynthesis cysteine-adding enzyme BshC n=1 Tax=Jiulongibacter sediminis TaxID=1605367 RepID=UPI0026EAB714|nr:bacillithiol biosynthesis cysteine-adding enzyme BshC [Jiulongibacter sediminis]
MEYTCQRLPLSATGAFSDLFIDYMNQKDALKSFYSEYPAIENFKKLIDNKSFSKAKRAVLVSTLKKQYEGLENQPDFDLLLSEKTFTVTTGHQLNIFSGPLYIPFKIITIINLAKDLKKAYPDYDFVPVYWMATEDHDLEEIQSTRAFDQKILWDTHQQGAVGRMRTTGLPELAERLGKAGELFKKAYSENELLGDAVRAYMHELFGLYGLVTLDADDRELKGLFKGVIKDDLTKHSAEKLVSNQSQKLAYLDYKTQITAREINFFYLAEGLRERIIAESGKFQVLNTDLEFSEEELLRIVDEEPERFSPNVVLRPLYEEMILPNLAYIGGPSEVPYWLQLKPVFDHYGEAFPALMPRNFGMLLSDKHLDKCEKLHISAEDLFKPLHDLQKNWVEKHSEFDLNLNGEILELKALFERIEQKTSQIDSTLNRTAEAFETKSVDLLERLEKKIRRAEKRKHAEAMNQLENLKNLLFPGGGLQERKVNITQFLEQRPDLIEVLIAAFDPLDYRFNLVEI